MEYFVDKGRGIAYFDIHQPLFGIIFRLNSSASSYTPTAVYFTFTSFRTCLFIVFIINIIIIHHSFTVHIFHIPTYRLNPPFHQTLPTMHLGCWYPSYCLHGLSDPFCGCYMLIFLKLLGQPRPTTTCEVRFHSHVLKCLFVDNITEKRFVKMFVCWQHYGKSS